MGRSVTAAELNTFVTGFITEASPLTFPANATIDEANFELLKDGSRKRRLGIDLEDDYVLVNTNSVLNSNNEIVYGSFKWSNAGGNPEKTLIVIQIGNTVKVFDADAMPLSSGNIFSYAFFSGQETKFGFASVDGLLVITSGMPEVTIFDYRDSVIHVTTGRVKVRDQFGVEDIVSGENLRQGMGVGVRPTSETDAHIYNLRNQTWALPRKSFQGDVVVDPIANFRGRYGRFPANSDNLNNALYPETMSSGDNTSDKLNLADLAVNQNGSFPAPLGFFIIDALARGSSRMEEYQKLRDRNPKLAYGLSSLPIDTTVGGPTVVAEYGGRAWYAGFSGEVIGPDANSPRMASYVLFSQLVDDPSDIFACYQAGDPTSKQEPDLLDTDGGFIRIDGAYGITGLVNVGAAMMVIASNGVWMVQGGSDYGFKATNYLVTKITRYGCDCPGSIVNIDNTFMYWSDSGIYRVAPDQFGDYKAENLSERTIQTYYENINDLDRFKCVGVYDNYEKKVRWLYNNRLDSEENCKELIFDLGLGAFYISSIKQSLKMPLLACGVTVPAFRTATNDVIVTVDGVDVTTNGVDVTTESRAKESATKEVVYLVVTKVSPTIQFTFASYKNLEFRDWGSLLGSNAQDAEAYMITGWMSNGDYQRYKQVPFVTFHFNKTETGFSEDSEQDFSPTNPSSCLVSSQWEWSNSASSGQWGREFQAYRFKRHWTPTDSSSHFDNGYKTVVTRNKLRGKGRVVSFKIRSEPYHDLHLLGWSMIMNVNGNV